MATESPIRMLETSAKWPRHREAAIFVPSTSNMAAEELGMLQKPHMIHGNGRDVVPNRSGSAPPSMEGSFLAMDDLSCQQKLSMNPSLPSLNGAADPSYLAYYASNVNLNPRICPTLISWENQRPVFHGKFGNNWGLTSIDDGGNSSFHMSQGALSIHKEESEDDSSPQYSCDGILDQTSRFWSGHDAAPLAQNLVQEDSSHTSSPVYMQPGFLSHKIIEESGDHDADSSSLRRHTQSLSSALTSPVGSENVGLSSDASFSSLSSRDCTEIKPSAQTVYEGVLNGTDIHAKNEVLVGSVRNSDIRSIICDIKNLNISNLPNLENQEAQEQRQHNCQNVLPQHQTHQQQSNSFEVQSSKSQMSSQGVNGAHIGMDQFLHKPSKLSLEVQPVLQCSGLTPPLYATAAAYMTSPNPFYPNVQAPNLYSPQYGVGEYPLTSVFQPFFTGYIPQSAIPLVFEGTAGPNFNVQMSGVSSGESVVHAVDIQNFSKFYGQVGFTLQPSFADPNYMQYYQQTLGQSFNMPGQIDQSAARGGVTGNRKSVLDLQKGWSDDGTSLDNQKFYNQKSGQGNQNPCQVDIMNPHYYGNQPNVGILMQYPSSPLASPILPGSPSGGTTLPGGRNEMRYPPGSGRFAGAYSEWQGQRARESFNDSKVCNLLQDLKSGKGRRFDLPDIAGHIVEFSTDQHGSRFIQQKLENCGVEEKGFVFKEVLPHASTLMTDVFGNYVIQKFFEYGSSEQRKELANQLTGQILPLSLQMYGCRVIQKALEVVELDQKAQLVHELDGHVMRCVRDQNGNHVIQKCIESVPTDKIGFIISAFRSQVATLSMHPYGCRVIQRVLEHCTCEHQCKFIVDEILDSVCALAQDQYGNYVMQHVLERGKPDERGRIISKLTGHIVQLSQHKFASNVIEKCLEYGGPSERDLIIEEIVGQNEASDNLFTMMKDQFANYVVQKIVEISTDDQRAMLLSRIRTHAHALKKYTYGKHIVARFEQLFGEDSQASGS